MVHSTAQLGEVTTFFYACLQVLPGSLNDFFFFSYKPPLQRNSQSQFPGAKKIQALVSCTAITSIFLLRKQNAIPPFDDYRKAFSHAAKTNFLTLELGYILSFTIIVNKLESVTNRFSLNTSILFKDLNADIVCLASIDSLRLRGTFCCGLA